MNLFEFGTALKKPVWTVLGVLLSFGFWVF